MRSGDNFLSSYKYRFFYYVCYRYYKNSVDQKSGWNPETISWCKQEAQRQKLKEQDYWGGFILDEMKIQVNY